MAINGDPTIGPVNESSTTKHWIHDLDIKAPSGQDGVWSVPDRGSIVENLRIQGGDGTYGFALRIGIEGVE